MTILRVSSEDSIASAMNFSLPEGWVSAPLLGFCELIRGVSYKRGEAKTEPTPGTIPILRANNIDGDINFKELQYVPSSRISPNQIMRIGDVIVAMSSGSKAVVGKAASFNDIWEGGFGAFCGVLRPTPIIDWHYYGYFFQTRGYRNQMSQAAAGVNINNLKREHFNALAFPLPPIAEQKRIVTKVGELLERVNAARDRLDKVRKIMKRFRQSVLASACSGKLTEDWRQASPPRTPVHETIAMIANQREKQMELSRGLRRHEPPRAVNDNDLPNLSDSWQYVSSDTLFSFVTSGSRGWAKYYSETGAIFLRVGNLDHESISLDLSQIQRVKPPNEAEGLRTQVHAGDILISITADVGMIALVLEDVGEAYVNQHVALARPVEGFSKSYVAWYLSSSQGGQKQFEELQRGATKAGLGLGDIRSVAVPFPPVEEQKEIVRRIEALFKLADDIETRVAAAKARADKLTQSILAKTFRGELVPTEAELARQEGRDYESASVLLERIRQQRERDKGKQGKKR